MSVTDRNSVIKDIEERSSLKVLSVGSAAGGCIADSFFIDMSDGNRYLVKSGIVNSDVFNKEANGLKELSKSKMNVPKVIYSCEDYIQMEYIEQGNKKSYFFTEFGRSLARMHRYKADKYGFYEDNYIGDNIQINTENTSWLEFYFINRLLFQYKLAEENGYADKVMRENFIRLENKLPGIIEGTEEGACLLHGDLWGGNYLCNKKGEAVLIDPAVYYGHREADLAMTKLFGGFTSDFYSAYNEEWELIEDYSYREKIYMLYHILNHLNLFGQGYYNQVISSMKYYL